MAFVMCQSQVKTAMVPELHISPATCDFVYYVQSGYEPFCIHIS